MARYCGTCGAIQGIEALNSGRCPSCGAAIDASELRADEQGTEIFDNATRLAAVPAGYPAWPHAEQQPPTESKRRRSAALGIISVAVAAALLLAVAGILVLPHLNSGNSANLPPVGRGGTPVAATGTGSSSNAGTGPAVFTTTPVPGQTVQATTSPVANGTPTGSPTAIPSATPDPAFLSVSPTKISIVVCSESTTKTFTVSNTGGTTLLWSAKASVSGYEISPSGGGIDAGLKETVTVSDISKHGIITVSAFAKNSPQQVTISCTL
jgi:hypothetical protein